MIYYVLYAFAAVAAAIGLLVLIAALRPSEFRVTRSLVIDASPQTLFPYVNEPRKFQEWNPYKDRDPTARNEFSGAESGPGAVFKWNGDANVGEGIMTILSTVPNEKVEVDLEFIRPFPGRNAVEFCLAPVERGTAATWSMTGRFALFPKIIGLFIDMDAMIGSDFERGLKHLKMLIETSAVETTP